MKDFTKVSVQFRNSFGSISEKKYDYLSPIEVSEGDLVVVETQYGYAVATVSDVGIKSTKAKSFVVMKVDTSLVDSIKEKIARKAQIEKELEKRVKSQAKLEIYRRVAENDEVAKALLEELSSLED